MTPIPFPDPAKHDDPHFVAFVIVAALALNQMRDGDLDPVSALKTLWLAATGRSELIDFSTGLNAAVKEGNWLERLGLPEDSQFRGAGVRFFCKEHGHQTIETVAVGVHSESLNLTGEPPPAPDEITEQAFTALVAETAAAAGFIASMDTFDPNHAVSETTGMGEALMAQVNKKIDEETAAFRAELDKVFGTWKGGNNDDQPSD